MSHRYAGLSIAELQAMWAEKRRRIAELPFDEVPNRDKEELLSIRKEISKRTGDGATIVNVDFSEQYVTK